MFSNGLLVFLFFKKLKQENIKLTVVSKTKETGVRFSKKSLIPLIYYNLSSIVIEKVDDQFLVFNINNNKFKFNGQDY